jgi:predicted DCC family thiol-disulfide oxidoreductase YuxK
VANALVCAQRLECGDLSPLSDAQLPSESGDKSGFRRSLEIGRMWFNFDSMQDNSMQGWVLYDDSCGFCRRWIPFWAETLKRRGFDIAPLQAEWVRARLGVSDSDLIRDLLLLLNDGRLMRGAEVYRHVMRRIWWAYPLFLLSIAPLGRAAFDWGYRTFARNRFRVSRACGLRGGGNRAAQPEVGPQADEGHAG